MPYADIQLTRALIQKDLLLDPESLPESVNSLEDLEKKLVPVINYLLNKDMSRLLHALYRIDISEPVVKKVLTFEHPDHIATKLAALIVQRELQKVSTRKKYSD